MPDPKVENRASQDAEGLASCPVWFYCPADDPDRLDEALRTRATAVILDLEDTVLPERKPRAREALPDRLDVVQQLPPGRRPAVHVRINPLGTAECLADVRAVAALQQVAAIRVPKVRSAADVTTVIELWTAAGGTPVGVYPLIEDAAGVLAMTDIARAHPWVRGLCLGEADLRRELGLGGEQDLAHIRAQLVVASSAARLEPPMMAASVDAPDLEALAASCARGRAAGFWGRTVLTAAQVDVVEEAFRPGTEEVARAREVVATWRALQSTGAGSGLSASGIFVDLPVVEAAERVLARAGGPGVSDDDRTGWPAMGTSVSGPLAGLRVVDLSTVMMGPYSAQVMGDLGADVIKIETPDGDVSRHIPPLRRPGLGTTALSLNRNKRSVALDLKTPEGLALARRIIGSADVLLTNLRPKSLERLGLSYSELRVENPRLVYCRGTGFRSDSPFADHPAYDDIVQARAGSVDLTRRLTGEPGYVATVLADKLSGLTMLYASLAALHARSITGRGQLVEVPMVDTLYAFNMVEHLAGLTYADQSNGVGYPRALSRSRRPWPTADGSLCVLPYSDESWRAFFTYAGRPDVADDPRFAGIEQRTRHIDALYALAMEVSPSRTTQEWLDFCAEHGIAAAPVLDLEESVDDPYLRELVEEHEHPEIGRVRWVRNPVRFSDTVPDARRPCPRTGQDGREVARDLGLSPTQIEALVEAGVLVVDSAEVEQGGTA